MKNYSLNKESAEKFILNYQVINNIIIVNYANGKVEDIPCSKENEKAILEKMKRQVLNSKYFSKELNNKFEIFLKMLFDEVLLLVMFGMAIISVNMSLASIIVGTAIFGTAISLTAIKLNYYQNLRNDLKKQLLFLKNEDSLNPIIRNEVTVREKLDFKYQEKALESGCEDFMFTLNTIDNIGYSDLNKMYKQTEHVVNLEDSNLDRSKSLSKTKKRNRHF